MSTEAKADESSRNSAPKRRAGRRPIDPSGEHRECIVAIALTPSEHARLLEACRAETPANMRPIPPATMIRRALIGYGIDVQPG